MHLHVNHAEKEAYIVQTVIFQVMFHSLLMMFGFKALRTRIMFGDSMTAQ